MSEQKKPSISTPSFAMALVFLVLLEEGEGYAYELAKLTGCRAGSLGKRLQILRESQAVELILNRDTIEGMGPKRDVYAVTEVGRRMLGEALENAVVGDVFKDRPEFDLEISKLRKRAEDAAFEAQYE